MNKIDDLGKITIQELLNNRGIDPNAKIKMARHHSNKIDIYDMYVNKRDEFLRYQSAQKSDVFHGADYLVSFIGDGRNRARFIGVYKILGELPMDDTHRYDKNDNDQYYYPMEKIVDKRLSAIEERIIVYWKGARSWCQWYSKDKEVIELSPGVGYRRFTDYLDFHLKFDELSDIIKNEYPDWKKMLTAVYGVYVIYDNATDQLYIGSAYGENGGIWGRWSDYVKDGHGGNLSLKQLIQADPNHASNFTFSLVMILSKSSTKEAVIAKETAFKEKFGTKIHGLNNN